MTEKDTGRSMVFPSRSEYHHGDVEYPRRPSAEKLRRGMATIESLRREISLYTDFNFKDYPNWERNTEQYVGALRVARRVQKMGVKVVVEKETDSGNVLWHESHPAMIDPWALIKKTIKRMAEKERETKTEMTVEEIEQMERDGATQEEIEEAVLKRWPRTEDDIHLRVFTKFYEYYFKIGKYEKK